MWVSTEINSEHQLWVRSSSERLLYVKVLIPACQTRVTSFCPIVTAVAEEFPYDVVVALPHQYCDDSVHFQIFFLYFDYGLSCVRSVANVKRLALLYSIFYLSFEFGGELNHLCESSSSCSPHLSLPRAAYSVNNNQMNQMRLKEVAFKFSRNAYF